MPSSPVIWCLLSALLFGAATPASKALLDGMGPLSLAGLLYLGAALGVLPFSFRGGSPTRWKSAANLRRLGGAVFFGGIVGPVAVLVGLSHAPAASTALWLNLEGVATAFVASLFFREHIGPRVWAATACILAASVLLASTAGFSLAPAAILVFIGCVAWAIDNNLTSLVDGVTPAQSTLVKGAVAGTVNLGLAALVGEPVAPIGPALAALGVGALSYGLSIMLYISGSHQLGATRSQVLFSTAPFIGVLLSWFLLKEPVLPNQVGAFALVVAGVALMTQTAHRHSHRHLAQKHTHRHRHDDDHHLHTHPGLPPDAWHTHEHEHEPTTHEHPHQPDLHHRHRH